MMDIFIFIGVIAIIIALLYLFKNRNSTYKFDDAEGKLSGKTAKKIISLLPDVIYIVDNEYKIKNVLNSVSGQSCLDHDEAAAISIKDWIDPQCLPEVLAAIEAAFLTDNVQRVEYSTTIDGNTSYFQTRIKRLQKNLIACFEQDITEHKLYEQNLLKAKEEIEESQRINQLILDNSNSGWIYLTSDYTIQWENIHRYDHVKVATKYKKGQCCYETVMGLSSPCLDCVARKAFSSGKVEQDEIIINNDLTVEMTAIPVTGKDGDISGVVLKYYDVTVKQRAAKELERAKIAAETSDRLKSMFISNMSHEIRTPLNAIVGFSELLVHTGDDTKKQEYLSIIKRNNELLLQLINDILDLSKIESDTLEFVYNYVNINELLKDIELISKCRIEDNKDLNIVFTPGLSECVIDTEKNRIQQVVMNLVNNAIKFTDQGEINITYNLTDEGILFSVSDTGKGIPKEKQKDIFKRFVKLDNYATGTGLGLSICQTIINKLGGKIGVESEVGKGSTFWFTLPVRPYSYPYYNRPVASLESTDIDLTRLKNERENSSTILIAEDNEDNYKLYQFLLGKEYIILHARTGLEAINLFERYERDINLIIMDIKMPDMDGYEAVSVIRKKNKDIPIIAASAHAFPEDVVRMMESGFNNYISKPINQVLLFSKLKEYI